MKKNFLQKKMLGSLSLHDYIPPSLFNEMTVLCLEKGYKYLLATLLMNRRIKIDWPKTTTKNKKYFLQKKKIIQDNNNNKIDK